MNWNQIEKQWHQITDHIKEKWAKLNDEDLKGVQGKKEELIGKIQERYGLKKNEAETQVEGWAASYKPSPDTTQGEHAESSPVVDPRVNSSKVYS